MRYLTRIKHILLIGEVYWKWSLSSQIPKNVSMRKIFDSLTRHKLNKLSTRATVT